MELIPIKKNLEDNHEFLDNPQCMEALPMSVEFYKNVGYVPPWIGYFAKENRELVGTAGFKGPPVKGTVEIAYGTFENQRGKGLGTIMCKALVEIAVRTDASLRITARTLPEKNHSSRILEKNSFILTGTVDDPDDGPVWEWVFTSK